MSARALQDLVVLAHHGCGFVDVVANIAVLTDAERACFAAVDPRAFRGDAERQHRIVAAVIEELPVTCAVAGLDAVYALFHDVEGFGAVVLQRLSLVVRFAERLVPVVGDVARIEGGVARARRRRPQQHRGHCIVRAAGVEVVEVGEYALLYWQSEKASLGDDVVASIVAGRRLPRVDDDDCRAMILVEPANGSFAIAACSAPLAGLLQGLDRPIDDDDAIRLARTLGCDDDGEARVLLQDLQADGLLSRL